MFLLYSTESVLNMRIMSSLTVYRRFDYRGYLHFVYWHRDAKGDLYLYRVIDRVTDLLATVHQEALYHTCHLHWNVIGEGEDIYFRKESEKAAVDEVMARAISDGRIVP